MAPEFCFKRLLNGFVQLASKIVEDSDINVSVTMNLWSLDASKVECLFMLPAQFWLRHPVLGCSKPLKDRRSLDLFEQMD
jgi:hypothetical protein